MESSYNPIMELESVSTGYKFDIYTSYPLDTLEDRACRLATVPHKLCFSASFHFTRHRGHREFCLLSTRCTAEGYFQLKERTDSHFLKKHPHYVIPSRQPSPVSTHPPPSWRGTAPMLRFKLRQEPTGPAIIHWSLDLFARLLSGA